MSNFKKYLKESLKVVIKIRVRNVTMEESNKHALVHFPGKLTWSLLIPINKPVVETKNYFSVARVQTVPGVSKLQVPVKYDYSDTFERREFDGETVGKDESHNLVTCLCKLQSHNVFDFLLYFHVFYTYGKAMDHPHKKHSKSRIHKERTI